MTASAGPPPLPVEASLADIVAALRRTGTVLLTAPPGAGKTTLVPAALVDAGLAERGEVVVLQPRRIAARQAARRTAELRSVPLGDEVGYQVRHDNKTSRATRVRFVTEGVLLRQILADPELPRVAVVVLDEFHERHLETDLTLAMLREIRDSLRPDLGLVVMSATLEAGPLREFLPRHEQIDVEVAHHPVTTVYLGLGDLGLGYPGPRRLAQAVADGVARACAEGPGDVLVFLPGVADIQAAEREIRAAPALLRQVEVRALHGRLPAAEQDLALRPASPGTRKVVLSTNVAETSLTIPGVTAVVDAGFVRMQRFDPGLGLDRLHIERSSRASADQRRGRAGRTGPGRCYRLWNEAMDRGLPAFTAPEVRRVDLAAPLLAVHAFAGAAAARFAWLEPPDERARERAMQLLLELGAVAEGSGAGLTALGEAMRGLPMHPRLARIAMAGHLFGDDSEAIALATLLAEDIDVGADAGADGDLVDGLRAWIDGSGRGPADVQRRWRMARQQVERQVRRAPPVRDDTVAELLAEVSSKGAPDDSLRKLLLLAYPDRVAVTAHHRDNSAGSEGLAVGGLMVALPAKVVAPPDLFLAVRLLHTGRGVARAVGWVRIERAWLDALGVDSGGQTELDDAGRVVQWRTTRYRDLVLDRRRTGDPDREAAMHLLATALARDPWRWLDGKDRRDIDALAARLRWLRQLEPALDAPQLDDATLAELLIASVPGLAGLGELRRVRALPQTVERGLPPPVRAALERLLPKRFRLPSGRQASIDYDAEQGPVVASRIQDFFGLSVTPTIGGGRVPLCVQLLAPNQRPVQVTRDLASFWRTVYPQVRNELRRRYPRHAWPEDPLHPPPARGK